MAAGSPERILRVANSEQQTATTDSERYWIAGVSPAMSAKREIQVDQGDAPEKACAAACYPNNLHFDSRSRF